MGKKPEGSLDQEDQIIWSLKAPRQSHQALGHSREQETGI